jgi:iron-sulfur cluster repair protein YtfE (RIC family)
MTILDVVERYPHTEAVFRKYDRQAGVCLCCRALFKSLREMAQQYNLNMELLLDDLHAALRSDPEKISSQEHLGESSEETTSFHSEK